MPRDVMCHSEEMKHASRVYQFHSIELLQELLPPWDMCSMLIDDMEDEAVAAAEEAVIAMSMEELGIVEDAMLIDMPDKSIEEAILRRSRSEMLDDLWSRHLRWGNEASDLPEVGRFINCTFQRKC